MATKANYEPGLTMDGQFGTPTLGPGLPPEPTAEPAPSKWGRCPICGRSTSTSTLNALGMCSFCYLDQHKPETTKPTEAPVETAEEAPVEEAAPEETGGTCGAGGTSVCGAGGAGGAVKPMEVTPAPAYEKSEAQIAFEEMYGGKVTDWVEAGGYGIPEETQKQMIQQQTDSLKARETENIRVMRNNMERRGITNSGFVFANEQNIRSNTSVAIAGAISDVQIKSALIKLASFEKAMGAAGQFLGYLSEQSQLQYQPEFATWQAEQMAKMQAWQAKIDFQKMAINQAYQQSNIRLQAQLQSQLAEQQHGYNLELAEMELEANNKVAAAQGAGSIIGTVFGWIFGS